MTQTIPTLDDLLKEENWLEWRARTPAIALRQSEMTTTDQSRQEFVDGCRLLRLDVRTRGGDGGHGPAPVQLAIADTLNTPGVKFAGVLEPRRTTKTTSIQAVILGRMQHREDFQAGWTLAKADGGQKTAERFKKDIVTHLNRQFPNPRDGRIRWSTSNGREFVHVPATGAYLNIYSPGNDAFTSGGFDFAWIDEGQDASPELSADFLTSVPPTLDGRPGAQMVVSGTAPDYQEGNLLWHVLHMDRSGYIQHGVPPETDPELLDSWETVEPLVIQSHPGIGFTTPLEDVQDNFHAMTGVAFQREYLSIPGAEGSNVALISQPLWMESVAGDISEAKLPDVFAMAMFVHPDATYASLAAAWKDKKGKTHVCLLHHQEGVQGFAKKVLLLSRKHKRRVIFDNGSAATQVEVRALEEVKTNRPILRPTLSKEVGRAAVSFMNTLNQGDLRHYDQPELNNATEIAVKRQWNYGNGWSFGRPSVKGKVVSDADITGLEAVALAAYLVNEERPMNSKVQIDFFD